MEKYRIVQWEKYSPKGEKSLSKFYIEKQKKFLWWSYWTSVTALTGFTLSGGYYKERIEFTFISEAQDFIENVLVPGHPYDTRIKKTYDHENQSA